MDVLKDGIRLSAYGRKYYIYKVDKRSQVVIADQKGEITTIPEKKLVDVIEAWLRWNDFK